MIDELKLDAAHATAVVQKGIDVSAYSGPMPDDDEMVEAAHELVRYALDGWIDDNIRPESNIRQEREAAADIIEILRLAGITVTNDNNVTFGALPALDAEGAA